MTARRLLPTLLLGLALAVAALAGASPATAGADVRDLPGFVDLDWIRIPAGAAEIQDITLDPVLAGLAAAQPGSGEDEALRQALAMVKSVRVKSFSLAAGQDASGVAADVKKLQDRLEKDHWQRLVYMKDGEETVTISTLYRANLMVGLMLLTYEPGDSATFVNVVGDLDLPTLMRLAGQMHGEQLHGLLKGIDGEGPHDDASGDKGGDADSGTE